MFAATPSARATPSLTYASTLRFGTTRCVGANSDAPGAARAAASRSVSESSSASVRLA